MKSSYQGEVIWILGASSGIGAALARELSKRGATLALSARRKNGLDQLNLELENKHKVFELDVTDTERTLRTAQAIRASFDRLNRVIFLAGVYAPMELSALDMAVTKTILEVNLTGAFNLVHAVLPILKAQPIKGQLALCGSVAGYVGLAGGQPYSATKAAIINLAESLEAECGKFIDIKLISPGFVRTQLTDKNDFTMPYILEPEQAAKAIVEGLQSNSFELHFPKKFTYLLKTLRLLPYWLSLAILRKIEGQGRPTH